MERENLVANAESVGAYLLSETTRRLSGHPLVGDVRGIGMMCGVELDEDKSSHRPFRDAAAVGSKFSKACWDEGLIVRGGHGKVMVALAPPLVITRAEVDETVTRLGRALDRMVAQTL
jgi:adenosylmethionine-8-amino-7-oxononanoate aminotransferase